MENYINNINLLYVTEIYKNIECDRFFPVIKNEIFKIDKVI